MWQQPLNVTVCTIVAAIVFIIVKSTLNGFIYNLKVEKHFGAILAKKKFYMETYCSHTRQMSSKSCIYFFLANMTPTFLLFFNVKIRTKKSKFYLSIVLRKKNVIDNVFIYMILISWNFCLPILLSQALVYMQ